MTSKTNYFIYNNKIYNKTPTLYNTSPNKASNCLYYFICSCSLIPGENPYIASSYEGGEAGSGCGWSTEVL